MIRIKFSVVCLLISGLSFSQTLYAPGGSVGTSSSSGKIGIGVSSPESRFEIRHTGTLGGKFDPSKAFLKISDNSTTLLLDGNEIYANHILALGSSYSHDIRFRNVSTTGYQELMSIKPNGNIGIGTTSPLGMLHVSANTSGDAVLRIDADTDNNLEGDNSRIEMFQDGGSLGAYIGFNQDWPVSSGDAANLFRIGTRYSNVDNFDRLVINGGNGNVGLGTSAPSEKLHISSGSNGDAILKLESDTDNSNESDNAEIFFSQDGGLVTGFIGFEGNANSRSTGTIANAFILGSENNATRPIQFVHRDEVRMTIGDNVGIGTTSPAEKLEVNGTIRSKEVKVEASPWPDYVFEPNYKLRPLEEIEKFIQAEKHLPDVPSSAEVEENGIALGEMNALLLKKIEELTLHLIEVSKQNDHLIETVEEQNKRLEKLEKD